MVKIKAYFSSIGFNGWFVLDVDFYCDIDLWLYWSEKDLKI